MTSNALTTGGGPQGGALGFVTSGTIDWVAFGNTILTVSTAALQRFASAGVQPATYQSVIVIGSQFQLSYCGEQRLQVAIDGLSGIAVNSLYMGFGYRCLVREMWDIPGGVNCVALCACLAEAHTEADAAWILIELWRLLNSPNNFAPSHAQLMALVKACAGVIAKTPFSEVINNMQSAQYRLGIGASMIRYTPAQQFARSKDIAKVLVALFKVSCGYLDNITITGGSKGQGNVIYSNVKEPTNAQVLVRYGDHAEHSAVVTSTTYTLSSYSEMFDRNPENQYIYLVSRHPWDGCLSALFGIAFEKLQQKSDVLGNYLGSVARIYEALALGEKATETISFLFDSDSVESAYGLGFVNNILSTFPELGRLDGLQTAMISAAQVPFEEALEIANTSVVALEATCYCQEVTNTRDCPANEVHLSMFAYESPNFCIASIAFAIRDTARLTARIVQDPWYLYLKPTIAGLNWFRLGHQTPWERAKVLQLRLKSPTAQEETTASLLVNAIGFRTGDDLSSLYRPNTRGLSRLLATSLLFQGPPPPAEHKSRINDNDRVNPVSCRDDWCTHRAIHEWNLLL
ncbi:hypothetical protein MMC17_003679 [Xylographa soralifera]|nr:hypothetical protein [Xylographa soralifera]